MSYKALVIGLGQIGMGYDLKHDNNNYVLTHSRAFQQHLSYDLIAGCDPDLEKQEIFELEYQCPAYSTVEEVLKNHKPDIVAVAVPTKYHYSTIRNIFNNSKPDVILCEKPLSNDLEESKSIIKICAENNCKLYVNYMRQSDPGVVEIKKRISTGGIQKPIKGVVWYSKGVIHSGSHFFNLLQSLLGEPIDYHIYSEGRLWDDFDPEPEFSVDFEQGTVSFLAAREERFSHYTFELIAGNGRLRYEMGGNQIHWQNTVSDPVYAGYSVLDAKVEDINCCMERYQYNVVQEIYNDLNGKPASVCTGDAAFKTLDFLFKIVNKS